MEFFFIISIILSVAAMAGVLIPVIRRFRRKGSKRYVFTFVHLLTFGVFLSSLIIHLPFYYADFEFLDPYTFIRPILMSVHSTLQAFVLGFNYKDLIDSMPALNPFLNAAYTFWVATLYVVAPILTLTNILSLFKDLGGELRIRFNRKKPLYIFSELNPQSIAMAKSIYQRRADAKKDGKKVPRQLIVFTDVFSKEDETDQELLDEARSIGAICLKADITQFSLPESSCQMEFFLIGVNESENIEQTITLNEQCKKYPNRSLFVFSSKPGAGYILDTLDKGGHTVSPQTKSAVNADVKAFLSGTENTEKTYQIENCYYIRRIDSINTLTVNTLTDNKLLEPLIRQASQSKTISLMIVGFGMYGEAFLKNALWLFQLYGFRLCINIIDTLDAEFLRKRIRKEMPQIDAHRIDADSTSCLRYCSDAEGDCRYDIRVYPSVDCDTSDLSDLFLEKEKEEKDYASFSGTQLSIVTLGEDDRNIEIAVELRRLFDRINRVNEKQAKKSPDETPVICSVVYDNRTAKNLNCSADGTGIINYKGTPFHIHFIGQLSSHYNYSVINHMKLRENKAIWRHFEWIKSEESLRACYRCDLSSVKDPQTREMLEAFRKEMKDHFDTRCGGRETWGDDYLYQDGEPVPAYVMDSILSYTNFEYYRNSSIAREIHQELLKQYFPAYFDAFDPQHRHRDIPVCSCEKCRTQRITEHMRWNAYMSVNGYIYSDKRSDRAKTHNDLTLWQELDAPEKYKD